jgi:putative ABC transport system permease protein
MNRLGASSDGILVNGGFLAQQGLAVGDPLRLTVGAAGTYAEVAFTVVGALDLFPTLYPQDGPSLSPTWSTSMAPWGAPIPTTSG